MHGASRFPGIIAYAPRIAADVRQPAQYQIDTVTGHHSRPPRL
jgi:hypothetical protein